MDNRGCTIPLLFFEKPKAACAVRIEEMIEDPKKDAAPCVALIEDAVKTKMDS